MDNTGKHRCGRRITQENIQAFSRYLSEEEKSIHTVEKYVRDMKELKSLIGQNSFDKTDLIRWKNLIQEKYAISSVNGKIAALNCFLKFMGWLDWKIKPLKIQKCLFARPEKEMTKLEYIRLIQAAEQQGNERLSMLLQTICSTGIRVSELRFITAEAVFCGRAEVEGKGKRRTVFLSGKLCRILKKYIKKNKISSGEIFITKGNKTLNRSNIWREMKKLCAAAGVEASKVFPHNLRKLFAKVYYKHKKDLAKLADLLGHSSILTTRIYIMESGNDHAKQIEKLNLIIT